MLYTPYLNNHNIYPIPCGSNFGKPDEAIFLIYAPLSKGVTLSLPENIIKMESYLKNKDKSLIDEESLQTLDTLLDHEPLEDLIKPLRWPSDSTKISILPNYKCNFSCSYCYSAKGRSGKELTKKGLTTMLDGFITPEKQGKGELGIFFAGGGEPLLSWPLVKYGLTYAHTLTKEYGLKIYFKIITNGGIITDDMIETFLKYKVFVCVSYEILEDIQNLQRGHFETVTKNISHMIEKGLIPSVNATITKNNVFLQKEMVETLISRFPKINSINFDPVMDRNAFNSIEDLKKFYDDFTNQYFVARKIAKADHRGLNCTIRDKFEGINNRYCPGFLCLTPEGTISACHKVSSPVEDYFELCNYGDTKNGKIVYNLQKFDTLININVKSYSECENCFAKWHCGGGCLAHRNHFSKDMHFAVCHFNKNFFKRLLLERLEYEYYNDHYTSLADMIKRTV
ncbi:MAG: radical SAM protein [Bacteroidales bacterium]|nr:radical SAM protein [Bacteroidales bacterium]